MKPRNKTYPFIFAVAMMIVVYLIFRAIADRNPENQPLIYYFGYFAMAMIAGAVIFREIAIWEMTKKKAYKRGCHDVSVEEKLLSGRLLRLAYILAALLLFVSFLANFQVILDALPLALQKICGQATFWSAIIIFIFGFGGWFMRDNYVRPTACTT